MRTVMLTVILAALTVMLIGEHGKDKAKLWDTGAEARLAASFVQYRTAAMAWFSALSPAQRTAMFIDGETVLGAVAVPESALTSSLPEGWSMPANGSGGSAWEAWIALYADTGSEESLAAVKDYFGGGRNAHVVLWVLSTIEDGSDTALATQAGRMLDWPKGLGLACTDLSEGTAGCRKAQYAGIGVPAASRGGAIAFRDGGAVSAMIFERGPAPGDAWSEYGKTDPGE